MRAESSRSSRSRRPCWSRTSCRWCGCCRHCWCRRGWPAGRRGRRCPSRPMRSHSPDREPRRSRRRSVRWPAPALTDWQHRANSCRRSRPRQSRCGTRSTVPPPRSRSSASTPTKRCRRSARSASRQRAHSRRRCSTLAPAKGPGTLGATGSAPKCGSANAFCSPSPTKLDRRSSSRLRPRSRWCHPWPCRRCRRCHPLRQCRRC
jgi:hypothetical protein